MARKRTGTLVYRKKGWCAMVTIDKEGETVRDWVVLGTHDRSVAKRKLARIVAKNAPVTPAEVTREDTVNEFKATWIERRRSEGIVMAKEENANLDLHVLPEIGDMPLSAVRPVNIREVIAGAIAKGLSKQTVRHIRAATHRVFKAAWMDELIPDNPVDRAPVPKMTEVRKERVILTDAEFAQYMASPAGDLELKLMSLVARVEGGMRTSDVNRWDWAQIDRVQFAECVVPRSKTGTPQKLAMPEVVSEAMRLRWDAAGKPESGPVFPCRRGKRAAEFKAVRGNSYAKRLRRDLFRAGVVRVAPVKDPADKAGKRLIPSPSDPLYHPTALTLPVDFHSFRRAFSTASPRPA